MPDPKKILQDPEFAKLPPQDRRSIIDDLIKQDSEFSRLPETDRNALKTQLYGQYAGSPSQTSVPPSQAHTANRQGSLQHPTANASASSPSPTKTPKPPKKLHQPTPDDQAQQIIQQNMRINRPPVNMQNPLDLHTGAISQGQFALGQLSRALGAGGRFIAGQGAIPQSYGGTGRVQPPSPVQQAIERRQARMSLGARLQAEPPGGPLRQMAPDFFREADKPSKSMSEALIKSTVRGGADLLTLDNAAIAALLGPVKGASLLAKTIKLGVTGYFGLQVDKSIGAAWDKYKQSGYKDKDALSDVITSASMLGVIANHGVKEATGASLVDRAKTTIDKLHQERNLQAQEAAEPVRQRPKPSPTPKFRKPTAPNAAAKAAHDAAQTGLVEVRANEPPKPKPAPPVNVEPKPHVKKATATQKASSPKPAPVHVPGVPSIEEVTGKGIPDEIGHEFFKKFTDKKGAIDLGRASDEIAGHVERALENGKSVTLYSDGKSIPIVAVNRGMMQDANGQRWGTLSIASDNKGNNKVVFSDKPVKAKGLADVPVKAKETLPVENVFNSEEPKIERKHSGLDPSATMFNTPPERLKNYGWRTMGKAEYDKLIAGNHSYTPESAATRGQFIAPAPQSAAQYGTKGKYLVEFHGTGDVVGEGISNQVGKDNVTAVWQHDGKQWVKIKGGRVDATEKGMQQADTPTERAGNDIRDDTELVRLQSIVDGYDADLIQAERNIRKGKGTKEEYTEIQRKFDNAHAKMTARLKELIDSERAGNDKSRTRAKAGKVTTQQRDAEGFTAPPDIPGRPAETRQQEEARIHLEADVRSHAKGGFTKFADVFAKSIEGQKLTAAQKLQKRVEFARQLLALHESNPEGMEWEFGQQGNAKHSDVFIANDKSGKPIRYYGASFPDNKAKPAVPKGKSVDLHSVTKADTPYRDPDIVQELIDDREDELETQGIDPAYLAESKYPDLAGKIVAGKKYSAMPQDLEDLYNERDRGLADQNYRNVEKGMTSLSKESKSGELTENDIRETLSKLASEQSFSHAMNHSPSDTETFFRKLYNYLAWKRAGKTNSSGGIFPRDWVSLDDAISAYKEWPGGKYGRSPEPFLRQVISIFKDITGEIPDIGLPAIEKGKTKGSFSFDALPEESADIVPAKAREATPKTVEKKQEPATAPIAPEGVRLKQNKEGGYHAEYNGRYTSVYRSAEDGLWHRTRMLGERLTKQSTGHETPNAALEDFKAAVDGRTKAAQKVPGASAAPKVKPTPGQSYSFDALPEEGDIVPAKVVEKATPKPVAKPEPAKHIVKTKAKTAEKPTYTDSQLQKMYPHFSRMTEKELLREKEYLLEEKSSKSPDPKAGNIEEQLQAIEAQIKKRANDAKLERFTPTGSLTARAAMDLGMYFDEGDPLGDKLMKATRAISLTPEERARAQKQVEKFPGVDPTQWGLEPRTTKLPQGSLSDKPKDIEGVSDPDIEELGWVPKSDSFTANRMRRNFATGKASILRRISSERSRGLSAATAEVATSWIKALHPDYLKSLGSSYFKDSTPSNAPGSYIGLAPKTLGQSVSGYKSLIEIGKYLAGKHIEPERVIPHEIAHHIESQVSPEHLRILEREYQRQQRLYGKEIERARQDIQNIDADSKKDKTSLPLTAKGERQSINRNQAQFLADSYRYQSFSEFFAESIADRAIEDHFRDKSLPAAKGIFQRVMASAKGLAQQLYNHALGLPDKRPSQVIYDALMKGDYLKKGEASKPKDPRDLGRGPQELHSGVDLIKLYRDVKALPAVQSVGRTVDNFTRILTNTFVRNLTGIERESRRTGEPSLLRAARKTSSTTQQVNIIKHHALPLLRKIFNNDPVEVDHFFNWLAEGHLRGAMERWDNLATKAGSTVIQTNPKMWVSPNPRHPASIVNPAVHEPLIDVLRQMQGKPRNADVLDPAGVIAFDPTDPAHYNERTHFAPNLAHTAEVFVSNGMWPELRELLTRSFLEAKESTHHIAVFAPDVPDHDDFDAYGHEPNTKEALKLYKEQMEKPLHEAYIANKGTPSVYLGPLNTYFPLVPPAEDGKPAYPVAAPRGPMSEVGNPATHFTTGLSEDYDTSVKAVMDTFERQLKANNRGGLIRTIVDGGFGEVLHSGDKPLTMPGADGKPVPAIMVNGVKVRAYIHEHKMPFRVVRDGKSYTVPSVKIVLPAPIWNELKPILEGRDPIDPEHPLSLVAKVNELALLAPPAAIMHNANLLGAQVSSTPFIGEGLGGVKGTAALTNLPMFKMLSAITSDIFIDPTDAKYSNDLQYLAKIGALHPKSGTLTVSKKHADASGKTLTREPASAMLYGSSGTELRTRLALYNSLKAWAGANGVTLTDEDVHDYVNQAGNYSAGLESGFERFWKRSGFAPFVTAGKTQIEQGIRAGTGTTRIPRGASVQSKAAARAYQQISGGLVGAVALWYLGFKSMTGRWPGKKDTYGRIPLRPEWRASRIGQTIFGKGTNEVNVSTTWFNPTLPRGMMASGMGGTLEAMRKEGKLNPFELSDTAVQGITREMMNGLSSPVLSSPTARGGSIALFGKEPYVTSFKGKRGEKFDPQFIDAVDPNIEMSKRRIALQLYTALVKSNPYTDIATQTFPNSGVYRRPDRKDDSPFTVALKTAIDLAFPRLLPFNPPAKQGGASKNPMTSLQRRNTGGVNRSRSLFPR